MKLKAKHNILLPDGKTEVKVGEVFNYEGDISPIESVVEILPAGAQEKKETEPDPTDDVEEKAIREEARLLGIKSAHNKNIEKLKAEIAEKKAEAETPADPEGDQSPAPAPETAPASTPAPEDETKTPAEGDK